jgi:hypothetical protein
MLSNREAIDKQLHIHENHSTEAILQYAYILAILRKNRIGALTGIVHLIDRIASRLALLAVAMTAFFRS